MSNDPAVVADNVHDEPLIPTGPGGEENILVTFDASGLPVATRPTGSEPVGIPPGVTGTARLTTPCSRVTLNGSWLLTIVPQGPHLPQAIRGPLRIETSAERLRLSGDIYVRRLAPVPGQPAEPQSMIGEPFIPGSLVIRRNWYPAFPQPEYRWYFRSLEVTFGNGVLSCRFERHLWDAARQEFVSSDTGSMSLDCRMSPVQPVGAPQPTLQMTGTMTLGGQVLSLTATKTSPYYRGCFVEVDVMTGRTWPSQTASCDGSQTFTFVGIYRTAGLDFRATVNDLNVPEDAQLSTAELHTLLASQRSLSAGGDNWHLWLLVGSRTGDGTLGIMFDTGNPPHREGAVGFFDAPLGSGPVIHPGAQGKKLGEVPLAFLRTLVHEAGHAFNLFHPKHDVHGVPLGTTIMNQTGDVLSFATPANPYPCNATIAFGEHNRASLIHSPDPQVKPGWKEFGWGHGSVSSGIAEPIDAAGIDQRPLAAGLLLEVDLPAEAHRGEFVWATVTLHNVSDRPRVTTTALNLAEDDLRVHIETPSGGRIEARDVVLVCGQRRLVELAPGGSIAGQVQLFYGPRGLTFDQPGRYLIKAELEIGDGTMARSAPRELVLQPAVGAEERDLERHTMDPGVGLSLALGDFGTNEAAREKLAAVAERFSATETGSACALVLANALARPLRDGRTGATLRPADAGTAGRALDLAAEGCSAEMLAKLTAAVVSPRETTAPVLGRVKERLTRARRGTYASKDVAAATKVLADHLA